MWLLDRVSAKIKFIYQQFSSKSDKEVADSFPNTFFTLNDLGIRYKDDTIEIDQIIIGPSGIYCIQEVNFPGLLSGDKETWIHETEKKKNTYKNPYELVNKYQEALQYIIRQNEKYLFNDPLKSDEIPHYPIIINIAKTGRISIKREEIPVIKSFDLKRTISINSKEEILTQDECMKIGKLLMSKNVKKPKLEKEIE